jgi:glycosyltransferase involved in cell wall biosynthesis
MNILLVGQPEGKPTDGGGYTFQQVLKKGFQSLVSEHNYLYIEAYTFKIQDIIVSRKIDFVWFLFPFTGFMRDVVDVPFAITVWDLGHREVPYFPEVSVSGWTFPHREAFYKDVLPRASFVIIGTLSGAEQVTAYYQIPKQRIKIIPLPVSSLMQFKEDSTIFNLYDISPKKYLLYPAQFWPHKNHITLIDAIKILKNADLNTKLVLTGSDKGNLDYIKEYVRQNNLEDLIIFTGFISQDALYTLYKHAFAMVFASLMGPDNLPPIEAMQLGCPVVCSNYNGAYDQLGEAAIYFDGLNPMDLAEKIISVLDEGLREKLVISGSNLASGLTETEYIKKIDSTMNEFSKIRKLWGPANSYIHL